MVWAAFGSNGKSELIIISEHINSGDYCEMLKNHLLSFGKTIGGKNWIFQQDNASIHDSYETKEWFKFKKVRVLEWPAISPDLNPMENVWGILVRRLFADGKQYSTVKELEDRLCDEWEKLSKMKLNKLINSIPNRCIEVIKSRGATIKY